MSSSQVPVGIDLVTILRQDLKTWEKAFADTHAGQKPSRDDIKNDRDIAQKYKEFHRLARPRPEPRSETTPRKAQRAPCQKDRILAEKSTNIPATTTPRKKKKKKSERDGTQVESEDLVEEQQTPAFIRCALGPTPQKDGQVLGIFDLPSSGESPSKPVISRQGLSVDAVAATPSRRHAIPLPDSAFCRTPQSSSKRFYLDAFAGTPLKRKRNDEDFGTPDTVKKHLATPAFLRRSWKLGTIDEADQDTLPIVKKPTGARKGLVRSLSTIITGLRKQEDERMDEEWDILNEMETEQSAAYPGGQSSTDKTIVEDSQVQEMPLGPDQAPRGETDDEEEQTIARPWKKKGLKRQTKRVNMKPVVHAPQKAAVEAAADSEGDDASAGDTVRELLPDVNSATNDIDEHDNDRPRQTKADKNPVAKVTRKISNTAHMNFRKLKIKSKNSKPKGGGRRFGKR